MEVYRHISKLIPNEAPQWLKDAAECGAARWCRVDHDYYAWILPIYSVGVANPFKGSNGNWYSDAEPVTSQYELDQTKGMR